MPRKIIIIGRAAVGKTTIKKIIFEGTNPKSLLENPLSPTRGIEISNYSWLDLQLGLFDTSGQELDQLLSDEAIEINYFKNADAIIYVIDSVNWENNSTLIKSDIDNINKILTKNSVQSQLIFFFHKLDAISKPKSLWKTGKNFLDKLNFEAKPKLYFTSISSEYIYLLYNAFFEIMSSFSFETLDLKRILDKTLEKYSKILIILLNKKNSILVQSMTEDFNPNVIQDIYAKISKNYLMSDSVSLIAVQMQVINVGPMIQNILKENVEIYHPFIKNIICIFELSDDKGIIELMKSIAKKIDKYYLKLAEKTLFG
ncbi:MAG: ADP-ribosylation factor-like protein [Promethearchaeota archaeon]